MWIPTEVNNVARPVALWNVDTQRDFCDPGGRLFVPGADDPAIRANWRRLIDAARDAGARHLATQDDHLLTDAEIDTVAPDFRATFPPHCMRTTAGAGHVPESRQDDAVVIGYEPVQAPGDLRGLTADAREILFLKNATPFDANPNAVAYLTGVDAPSSVYVFGVVTEICVARAVGILHDVVGIADVAVVTDAIRELDGAARDATLAAWNAKDRVRLLTTDRAAAEVAAGRA